MTGYVTVGALLLAGIVLIADPEFGTTTLVEMAVFVALLALALLYVWRKRVLTWT